MSFVIIVEAHYFLDFKKMAKTRQQKKELIKYYETLIDNSNGIIFTDNPGVKVNDVILLRKKLSTVDAQFHTLKNKLFKLAVGKKYEDAMYPITGTTAAVFAFRDASEAAKILKSFLKEIEVELKIKGGILGDQFINDVQAQDLASLPAKNELLAKITARINSPLQGIVNVLTGNVRNFIYVLNAVKEQKKRN